MAWATGQAMPLSRVPENRSRRATSLLGTVPQVPVPGSSGGLRSFLSPRRPGANASPRPQLWRVATCQARRGDGTGCFPAGHPGWEGVSGPFPGPTPAT